MTDTDTPIQVQPKIQIAVCTHRAMNPFFVSSLIYMLQYMNETGLQYEINLHVGVSNLTGGRQNRVYEAINSACTHVLFLDDDMVFAKDMVHKMLYEMNQLTISGARRIAMGVNPCRKSPTGLAYTAKPLDSEGFLQSKGMSGVTEVSRCGLGVFLIETQLLREVEAPHFEIRWIPEKKEVEGEDFYFINKLREHGIRVFVDNDISQGIGHAGEFIYSFSSYTGPSVTP